MALSDNARDGHVAEEEAQGTCLERNEDDKDELPLLPRNSDLSEEAASSSKINLIGPTLPTDPVQGADGWGEDNNMSLL